MSIALGLGPIAMSTDGAGSGRIPAACCGIYGLKATLGRVPHEVPPDQFGQLTYQMWRAVRLVVDTGLHAKGWTREQASEYMVGTAGTGEDEVVSELER